MKWNFKQDNRLLFFPITVLSLTCLLFFVGQLRLSFRLLVILWSVIYLVYFYRLHLLKNLQNSCKQIQFSDNQFQIYKRGKWIDVVLASNSLISYWLLALHWKQCETDQITNPTSYYSVILPSSMSEFEFKSLLKAIQKK